MLAARWRHAIVAALVTSCAAVLLTAAPAGQASGTTPAVDDRPNIVLITSDDQTVTDLRWMPLTRRLLGDVGVTFSSHLSPHPICCPARAEILTGQYTQNNGVRSNDAGELGGFPAFSPENTLATWLDDAGYQTAFVGKYLNGYRWGRDGRQPGWDVWNPTVRGVYSYFGYTMGNDGDPVDYPTEHNADALSRYTVDYIDRFAQGDAPFFIWASHVAPHGACLPAQELTCWAPPLAATRHTDLFPDAVSPSFEDPSFNESDVSDKPGYVKRRVARTEEKINQTFLGRIRSLQAVDEAVAAAIGELERTGELDNTYVVFTSDNGYLLGEHKLVAKNVPYEPALRVPMLMRGPGVPAGEARSQTTSMIDLAPTFADAAGVVPGLVVDGQSLVPLAADGSTAGWDSVLIQAGPRNRHELPYGWWFRGVRTNRYTYDRYLRSGFTELYDRRLDPFELDNVAYDARYREVLAELASRTATLGSCAGADCRRQFGPVPAPAPGPGTAPPTGG